MKFIKNKILKNFTPVLWFSLIALVLVIIVYKYFHLSLNPVVSLKNSIFILTLVCFFTVSFFYQIIINFKQWLKIKDLIKQTINLNIEFYLKIIPFFVLLYIYDSINSITHLINKYEFDHLLVRIDRFLLFNNDIALIFEKFIHPSLTKWFSFFYSLYFVFYLINPIIYFFLKRKKIFDIVLTTIIITCYLGLVGYILVPCVGPVLFQQQLFTKELVMPNGELYQDSNNLAVSYVFSRGSFHCFPSLHFGVTFVWLYLAWRYLRKEKYLKYLYYLHIPLVFSLWLATLYLRWHYIIDWAGGLIVALMGIWLAPRLVNYWYKKFHNK